MQGNRQINVSGGVVHVRVRDRIKVENLRGLWWGGGGPTCGQTFPGQPRYARATARGGVFVLTRLDSWISWWRGEW